MKIVIVIPTYNEAENVVRLVPQIAEQLSKISHEVITLFVDGNSPDGTAKKLEEMKEQYPVVRVFIEEEKGGLSKA